MPCGFFIVKKRMLEPNLSKNNILNSENGICQCVSPYEELRIVTRTYTLGEAIKFILKIRNIQVQQAGWNTGLAVSQVTRLINGGYRHTLRFLAQFCTLLPLEPYISRALADKAGISLTHPSQEDFEYIKIIDTMYGKGIDDINDYLTSVGITPFNIA